MSNHPVCASCQLWAPMPGVTICVQCMAIVGAAAVREGWRPRGSAAEKPCLNTHKCDGTMQTCSDWGRHCYEHGEAIHCAHCCNGTLFVPAGVTP